MKKSGYSWQQRSEITLAGLKGYEAKRTRAAKEGRGLHRDSKSTMGNRVKKKLLAKTNWYKKRTREATEQEGGKRQAKRSSHINKEKPEGEEKPPTAVIFVPRTPNGELASLLREEEKLVQKFSRTRVKIVEETGEMAKALVHKANHWAGENCEREECFVC